MATHSSPSPTPPAPLSPEDAELLGAARAARENAHAPVTLYRVGAALRAPSGEILPGCNVENYILSVSACAEQVAIWSGVARGHRRFDTVAVITESSPPAAPCGKCRQILHDWGVRRVVMGNVQGEALVMDLDALLPLAFEFDGKTLA